MKHAQKNLILLAAIIIPFSAAAENLRVTFLPQFKNAPLVFDSLKNQIASGQKISITRLDFLSSGFALRETNGIWIEQKNFFAFISVRDGKNSFTLENIPPENYDAIRFQIGLPSQINHAAISQWPANHPLNPDVNHLYWGWSREYVFLALEGGWQKNSSAGVSPANSDLETHGQDARATISGFSFHLATDRELTTIELPVELNLNSDRELQIALNADKIFSAPTKINLSDETDSTHSRTNDLFAEKIRENLANAFAVASVKDFSPIAELSRGTNQIEIAPHATPYQFIFADYFPQPDLPRDNPLTGEGVVLGGKLFFDRKLSANNSESCASCHRPREAFSEGRRFSRGIDGEIGTRNAMPLINLAWKNSFFWDGRAKTLREQILQPIQNPIEMHATLSNVVVKISADTNYARLFENAFGSPKITSDKIARAIEQFLLVQVSFTAKFDRVLRGDEKFTPAEQRGFELFFTEYDPYHGQLGADCFHCHGGPLFQSQTFANNGLDSAFSDLGLFKTTQRAGDGGKFAVPSLRNVEMTAPYMHDGRFRTLDEVVEHYCTGMKRSATLDPNLAKHPDGGVPLSADDKKALVAFLKTLTDEKFVPLRTSGNLAEK
jgi:cytochrome c peroxidase